MTTRDRTRDVVIVGAGPAGSMAALQLARRGHDVLLVDRHPFPRDKVCGDALIPDAVRCLERAGLGEAIEQRAWAGTITTLYSPSRIAVDIHGRFLTLKRLELDARLVEAATAAGATLAIGRVRAVDRDADGTMALTADGHATPIRSRIVMLATGADVDLAGRLDLVSRRQPTALALRCYVRSSFPIDRLVLSYDRAIMPGYAWIFPLGDGEYNVGCGALSAMGRTPNLRRTFERFVATFPLARDLMRAATDVTPLKGARLRCGLSGTRVRGPGNLLVIGEAAGTTFPFTGEGIGKAMETGELAVDVAAEALTTGDMDALDEYETRLDRELRPKFAGYALAERWSSQAWLTDLVAHRITRSRYLSDALAGIVNETVDPTTVFSVAGIVRSLFR